MPLTSYLDADSFLSPVPSPVLGDRRSLSRQPIAALVRGTGSIGMRHLRVLDRMGVDRIYAMPVRKGNRLLDVPESVRVVEKYPDVALDLVIIATDTARHVDDTLTALTNSPSAVLLEKPVSPDVASALELISNSRASTVYVSAPLRFHQGFLATAKLLPQLGRPTNVQVHSQSWLPSWRPDRDYLDSYSARAAEGGVLRDLVHDIDYPSQLLGPPSALKATLGYGLLGIESEEAADLLWGNDTTVHIRLDYVSRIKKRSLEINTLHGLLRWDVAKNEVHVNDLRKNDDGLSLGESVAFPDDRDADVALARQNLAILERTGASLGHLMAQFRPSSLYEGLEAVAVCDAARAAHLSRSEVKVSLNAF